MDFDIVVATRNRTDALRLSLPLMLGQARLPARLIVVDSSDDHGAVRRTVEAIAAGAGSPRDLRVIRSQAGSSHQRNVGLGEAVSPVVLFPDDDSLWFPGFAESVMAVYERDGEGLIGGVGGSESPVPPPGLFRAASPLYGMAARDRLQLSIGRFLDSVEYRLFPDPFFVEGAVRARERTAPPWLPEASSAPATTLPGFRMSFRTDLIRAARFDETLGRYSLFEDYDASLSVSAARLLVDAKEARVFHYRAPEARVGGFEWGAMQLLNRAYVVCKHSPSGSAARRRLPGYSRYKLLRYVMQAQTPYGRQRVRGAARALPLVPRLSAAPACELPGLYALLRERCIGRPPAFLAPRPI